MERDCLQEDSPVFGDWKKDYLDLSGTPACVHDDLLDFVSLIFYFKRPSLTCGGTVVFLLFGKSN